MANIGTGRGGKSFQDREKTAKLRGEIIDSLFLIINDSPAVEKWTDYKKQIILNLARNILPRLNEHTGEDGSPLQVNIIKYGSEPSTQPQEPDTVSN